MLAPGEKLGPFEILAPLGAGGMGEVYRARDTRLGRDVAVKVLPEGVAHDPDRLKRFEREARATAALSHPNVLTVFDVGTDDGRAFVVTELLEGTTLGARLRRGALPVREALALAAQAARGLAAAHARGIVHRDLKPENLFLTTSGALKVLDFGLARLVEDDPPASRTTESRATAPGAVLGTVRYMSPEQAKGLAVDARSDLFSLGVVLYETLSGRHPFSRSSAAETVSAILRDEPPHLVALDGQVPGPVDRLVRRCLEKRPEDRFQTAGDLALALDLLAGGEGSSRERPRGAGDETPAAGDERPYPGLASFSEGDAAHFFGREEELRALWERLRARRLLALIGPSGAGKTSFLRAGVLAHRPSGWAAVRCTPGASPAAALARALSGALAGDAPAVSLLFEGVQQFTEGAPPDGLVAAATRWRRQSAEALLVVDAFEELFTLAPRETQERFAALLDRLGREADLHVLLSMRDDFLFRCHGLPGLDALFQDLTPIGTPGPDALRRALVEPAARLGFRFEDPALVDEMLAAVSGERGALPLLAFAVSRLWDERDRERRLLTRAACERIGGVAGALARHAEETLERIGPAREPTVRAIFRELVTAEGTRASREREEIVSVFGPPPAPGHSEASEVLDALVASRLLTQYDDASAAARVEIVHESLLRHWPRLERWVAQDAEGALLRDQLRQAARLWDEKGRPEDLLWAGTSFLEYRAWRARYPGGLSTVEEAFARAMTDLAERRRRRRRAAAVAGLALTTALLAVVTTLWLRSEADRDTARDETRRAEASKLLALGESQIEEFPTLALAYATASLERADTEEGRLFALRAAHRGPPAMVLPGTPTDGAEMHALAFSRDGAWLAVGGYRKVQLFRREGGPPVVIAEHPAAGFNFVHVKFALSGDALVTVHDGQVRAWTVPGGRELWGHQGDRGRSYAIVRRDRLFTVTGRRAEGDSQEWVLREWDWTSGATRLVGVAEGRGTLDDGPERYVYQRGRRILARSFDRWSSPRLVAEHEADVTELAVSPDGRTVAAIDAARDVVRLWALEGRSTAPDRVLPAQGAFSLEFDASGRWLASRSVDGTKSNVRVWDLAAPRGAKPVELKRNDQPFLNGLTFTPDARHLVVANVTDVSFWRLREDAPRVLAGHDDLVSGLAFTPDGRTLLSASGDDTLRAWPLASPPEREPRVLLRSPMVFPGLAVDPVSPRVAVSGDGGRVFVIPLDGGPGRALEGFSDRTQIHTLAFSPDGRRLAAGPFLGPRAEKVVRVWDVESGRSSVFGPFPGADEGYEGAVGRLWFLTGNRLLALTFVNPRNPSYTVSLVNLQDGGIRLIPPPRGAVRPGGWPEPQILSRDGTSVLAHDFTETLSQIVRFPLEGGAVSPLTPLKLDAYLVALDPAEETVATASADGTIRLWTPSGGDPHVLFGHDLGVRALQFSPDGRWLASAGTDRTVRLWPVRDLSRPPVHSLPLAKLLAVLHSWTNVRVVPDAQAPQGYRVDRAPFPGWGEPTAVPGR